jgi:hypothetical protein
MGGHRAQRLAVGVEHVERYTVLVKIVEERPRTREAREGREVWVDLGS